ncbi:MAG: tetratricopeptide repeat protein [Phycisphaerae bacterium]|nr:tetratricopeptide repeat protein [Phycisphaerae bacterium]
MAHPSCALLAASLCLLLPLRTLAQDDAGYRAATGMLHRGLFDLAADEFRRFLDSTPNHAKAPHARYGLGVCLARQGRHAEAADALQGLDAAASFEFAPDSSLLRAQCLLLAGDAPAAAAAFHRTLDAFPSFDGAHAAALGLGEANLRMGDRASARAALLRVTSKSPDSPSRPRAELLLALADAADGLDAPAAERLASLRASWPDHDLVARAALAEAHSRQRLGQFDKAESLLARAAADPALAPEAALALARLRRESAKPADALAALDDFTRQWPTSPLDDHVGLERVRVLLDLNKPDDALALLAPLAKRCPRDLADDAEYWTAKALLRRGDPRASAARLADFPLTYADSELVPDAAYDLGVALARADRHADAAAAFAAFLQRHPAHSLKPDALAARASALRAVGDLDGARDACDRFLADRPTHSLARSVALLRADCDLAAGRDRDAADRLKRLLDAAPNADDAPATMLRLGIAQHRLADPRAAETLRAALDRNPPSDLQPAAWTALADISLASEDWSAAHQWLERRLQAADTPEVRLKLGIAAARQGRHAPAIEHLTKALAALSEPWIAARARFERGQSLEALGRDADAKADFEAVAATSDESLHAPALRHLAAIASRQGRHADAAAILSRLPESDASALHDAASSLLAAGRFADAEDALARFIATKPDAKALAEARAERAIAVARQERFDEAMPLLTAAESNDAMLPANLLAAVRADLGWTLSRLGKTDEAASAYSRVLGSTPPPPPAVASHAALELAWIEATRSHWEATLRLLDRANAPPTDCRAVYLRGLCLLRLNRPRDAAHALAPFADSLAACDTRARALLVRAEALSAQNRHAEAAASLTAAINASPDDDTLAAALLALGQAEADAQRWDASRDAFDRYLKRWPDGTAWFQARFGIGWALESAGRHQDAIAAYRAVTASHQGPTAARAQFQIGQCLFALGNFDEASRELLKVDILYAYPEWSAAALYEAARCLLRLDRAAEARQVLASVIDKHPDTRWADLARQRLDEARPDSLPGRAAPK